MQQARGSYRESVLDHELDVVEAARVLAMSSVVNADALIACFDAKYQYAFWRPITAIRAGGTDGNDATTGDAAWTTPSLTGLGDRHFAHLRDLQRDVGMARIWGGIHFRSAVEDGLRIAKQTANYVLARNVQRSGS